VATQRRRIQSIDRAVGLLHAIAALPPGEATLAAVAQRCRLNRSTAWRLLATLQHHRLVERDDATNSYGIGATAFQLAGLAGIDGLVRRAHPTIAELASATGETASLGGGRGAAAPPRALYEHDAGRRAVAAARAHAHARARLRACRGEQEPTSWGVSAPVIGAAGRPIAVVSVWGPSKRVGQGRFPALGAEVMEAAELVAQRLQPA